MCFSVKRGSSGTSYLTGAGGGGRLGGFGDVMRGKHPAGSPALCNKYKLPLLFPWCHTPQTRMLPSWAAPRFPPLSLQVLLPPLLA